MRAGPTLETLERLTYSDGTRLLERDFARFLAYEPGMLAAHLRCAHQTWGIGAGLGVTLAPSLMYATVGAGMAWNCRGEILGAPDPVHIDLPVPATTGPPRQAFDLLLRTTETLNSRCERPIARCTEELPSPYVVPRIEWVAVGDADRADRYPVAGERMGLDLPLARFVLTQSGDPPIVDPSDRRYAQPLRSSRIHAGITTPDKWNDDNDGSMWGTINTSDAHFSRAPVYVAWPDQAGPAAIIVGPWVAVEQAGPSSFVARVRVGYPADFVGPIQPASSFLPNLRIVWLGADPTLGCPPPPRIWWPIPFPPSHDIIF